jgi:hypothetical protein
MYIVSIDAIYYRYILAIPNLGNTILFNIKEENDQPEVIVLTMPLGIVHNLIVGLYEIYHNYIL